MKTLTIPANETKRLQALREYAILDTLPEEDFENITKIASEICQTPISLVTLIDSDRQWFKSNRGLNIRETPRDYGFCAHAINTPEEIFTIKDSRSDVRFSDNPLVTGYPNVIFYAGISLVNSEGFALGTLCVIDHKPRELTEIQLDSLRALSSQAVKLFELRKLNRLLNESQKEIEDRNKELEQFAYIISHDIKSPLRNITSLTKLLKVSLAEKVNEDEVQIFNHLTNVTDRLKSLVDGIVEHYTGLNIDAYKKSEINIASLIHDITLLLDSRQQHVIRYNTDTESIVVNEVAIKQILINLISNAIKYNNKAIITIDISIDTTLDFYTFKIKDNGQGIDKSAFDKIFNVFTTLGTKDRFNNDGTGIGLATVKKLIEKLGGTIQIESEIGIGSTFIFSIKK